MCTLVKILVYPKDQKHPGWCGALFYFTPVGQNKQGEGAPIYGPLSKRGEGKQNTGAYVNTGIPKCAFCTHFKWHTGRVDKEGETELAYIGVGRADKADHPSGA